MGSIGFVVSLAYMRGIPPASFYETVLVEVPW